MKIRFFFLFCTLVSGILFAAFTLAVREDIFTKLDFDLTVKLQNHTPVVFSAFFSLFSSLARFETTLILLLVFMLLSRSLMSIVAFASFAAMHVVGLFGKLFLDHPAPPHLFYRGKNELFFPSSYVHTEASYPSGHSMRTMLVGMLFIYMVIASKLPVFAKWVLCVLILSIMGLVFFTRVVLGEHWPTDVIGGVLWGATLGFTTLIFFPKKKNHLPSLTHH